MSVLLSGLIKNKSLCETIPSPNEIAKQVGGGGEEELSTKSPVLRLGFYLVVNVSVVAVIAQSSAHHPLPPPPKKKKLAKLLFCFIKNVREISAKQIAF